MSHVLSLLSQILLGAPAGVLLTFAFGTFQSEIEFRHVAVLLLIMVNAFVAIRPSIRKNKFGRIEVPAIPLIGVILGVMLVVIGSVLDKEFYPALMIIYALQIVEFLIYIRPRLLKFLRRL